MTIRLQSALRVSSPGTVAFTGAGGKTTAMFLLARELSTYSPVVVSASSHLGVWQTALADRHVVLTSESQLDELGTVQGVTLVTAAVVGDRTMPLPEDVLAQLHAYCENHSLPLLIEADGSRQKPLKAWGDHEPPIPPFAELVVEVAGLQGIGKPLHEEHVHRSEIFSALSELSLGEPITPTAVTRALMHPQGGQKRIPPNARKVVLLNQADSPKLQGLAQGMARDLLTRFDAVIVASLQQTRVFAVHEPVAGIILAAGESSRYGQPKQLLDWKGQPFVRAVARTALEAGLAPVIVVTGANAEAVERAVDGLDVRVVKNADWQHGQASSICAGVLSLTSADSDHSAVGAAIFLLTDQPQVSVSVLRALAEKHAEGIYPVVAPLVMDQRANPVLFDRITFGELQSLTGDVGGRAIFHKFQVEYVPWYDERLLLDVDTPEQYQRLNSDEAL